MKGLINGSNEIKPTQGMEEAMTKTDQEIKEMSLEELEQFIKDGIEELDRKAKENADKWRAIERMFNEEMEGLKWR